MKMLAERAVTNRLVFRRFFIVVRLFVIGRLFRGLVFRRGDPSRISRRASRFACFQRSERGKEETQRLRRA